MDKNKIISIYNNKIELIKKFNKRYYDENNPNVSDGEYDELKKEILSLEAKYKFLKSKDSPSKSVGYRPSKNFKKRST